MVSLRSRIRNIFRKPKGGVTITIPQRQTITDSRTGVSVTAEKTSSGNIKVTTSGGGSPSRTQTVSGNSAASRIAQEQFRQRQLAEQRRIVEEKIRKEKAIREKQAREKTIKEQQAKSRTISSRVQQRTLAQIRARQIQPSTVEAFKPKFETKREKFLFETGRRQEALRIKKQRQGGKLSVKEELELAKLQATKTGLEILLI